MRLLLSPCRKFMLMRSCHLSFPHPLLVINDPLPIVDTVMEHLFHPIRSSHEGVDRVLEVKRNGLKKGTLFIRSVTRFIPIFSKLHRPPFHILNGANEESPLKSAVVCDPLRDRSETQSKEG